MRNVIAVLSLGITISPNVAWAEGLPITPGMWETKATSENSMTGTRTHTSKECIKETEFDPRTQMDDFGKENCQVNSKVDGNTMTYDMVCAQSEGVKMTFNGRMTVNGDTMNGYMQMQGDMGGHSMTISAKSTGKRIGDC